MKNFVNLLLKLDQTNKTNTKILILKEYFSTALDNDKIWAIFLLAGNRIKRSINSTKIKEWALEHIKLPKWLFDESYSIVGDLSETISLLIYNSNVRTEKSLYEWMQYINKFKELDDEAKKLALFEAWDQLNQYEIFIFNKITFGTFRIGVSKSLVIRALAELNQVSQAEMQYNIIGKWDPFHTTYQDLISNNKKNLNLSKPYPFFLSYPLEKSLNELGNEEEWQVEWKWDGIRSQLIYRQENLHIWSRGEELVTDKFPEFNTLKELLNHGTVIDGEILPFNENILSFNLLQTRIGRKNITSKILKEVPIVIYAYDLLEEDGQDIRSLALNIRREKLEKLIKDLKFKATKLNLVSPIEISPKIDFKSWDELTELKLKSREMMSEGFMLKRKSSAYQSGRKRGDWWKWKVEPYSIDAVMLYAQRGHGKRANLYTDYTFALWDNDKLVPFAKAYSGLNDKGILEVNKFVLNNTKEKFGPVRSVKPLLVFEIGFEGLSLSPRHKSGVAVRFPRILRRRFDKSAEEANSLIDLKDLLKIGELSKKEIKIIF